MDNLSPKVDQLGLWGMFKPFGKVRDVYLFSKINSRKSNFAFIRFESKEEAIKVARTTNGMHVYGWPVLAKVASVGWNSRRQQDLNQHQVRGQASESYVKFTKEEVVDERLKRNRSFVEALVGKQGNIDDSNMSPNEKALTMSWSSNNGDKEWLNRCAVGILKFFSSVSSVNSRLNSGGFSFSSNYLGDKNVLWCFESEFEKKGFIKNRFFWDDCFKSMHNWSDSFNPQNRLAWIYCSGVPLSMWSRAFFIKLGGMIGEPLMVEEETSLKKRLYRGRVLVLIQQESTVSVKVKVSVRSCSYIIKLKEDETPPDVSWSDKFLGLIKEVVLGFWNMLPDLEGPKEKERRVVGELSSFKLLQREKEKKDLMCRVVSPVNHSQLRLEYKLTPKPGSYKGFANQRKTYLQVERVNSDDNPFYDLEGEGLLSDFNKWVGECFNKGGKKNIIENLNWNLDSRPVRVREGPTRRGEARGVVILKKKHGMMARGSSIHDKTQHQIREVKNKVEWCLEEEILKVMEKGLAIGFEFNG
ncbi:hypothetical protein Ddye_014683 [Dipteronia dyeriana]|uniref:RRM domain-containing protein n=1 Tax=Dipteronia dyeriana TaxID=168575 RepID=A0AAD9X8R3_9ROSI|nr:hypothetical protein Ddye_014683 [Dipteronia dyeriana]